MSEITHLVSFSGGMGSFAEAKACVDKFGKENVILLFADTLTEDEDLYRFVDECVQFLDVKLVRLCDGRNIWQLFNDEHFVANQRLDLCSRVLKRELLIAYMKNNFWIDNVHHHLGIDYSECHRLLRAQKVQWPWVYRSTLVEDGRFIEKDFSEQFGIQRPRLYRMGFHHNNCGGFCVKAGLGHFKILWEKMPERYDYHENEEQKTAQKHGTLPFLSKQVNGQRVWLTLKDYRELYLEAGKSDDDKFDIGGCNCAIPV